MIRSIACLLVVIAGLGMIACGNEGSTSKSIEEQKGPPEGGKVIGPLTIKFMGFEARSGGSKRLPSFSFTTHLPSLSSGLV